MASEYLLKKAREEALPREEKRELTKKEKWANWWHYHKWYVVAGAVALAVLAGLITDLVVRREPVPDYQIACIGSVYLPEDTTAALEQALASFCDDRNGDGQVLVKVKEYPLYADESAFQTAVAAQVQLSVDIGDCESLIYLVEDPEQFYADFELLANPDGSLPQAGQTEGMWYAWKDCPVLAGLELGTYTDYTMSGTVEGDNQSLYSGFYVARRMLDAASPDMSGAIALWQTLTEGADSGE